MVKIENIPLELLLSYQGVIESTSLQMRDFADRMEEEVKAGKISRSYFDKLLSRLQEKVSANNEIDEKIVKEVDKRIRKAFGSKISTPKSLIALFDSYEAEKINFEKTISKRKEQALEIQNKHNSKTIKLDTSVSTEKVVK